MLGQKHPVAFFTRLIFNAKKKSKPKNQQLGVAFDTFLRRGWSLRYKTTEL